MAGKTKRVARGGAGKSEAKGSKAKAPPVSPRSKLLSQLAGKDNGFLPWGKVVPPHVMVTRVTSLNRAMKCGGIPGGMFGVLHGPSQGGKTLLVSELLYSAWATGGLGLFVDAECRGVDLKWFEVVCGNLDEVMYYKPETFEDFAAHVAEFRKVFRKGKEDGVIPPEGMLCIGVDSLNRLAPADEMKMIIEGALQGRRYPLRAMLISAWLDGLIPTLRGDEVVVGVLREGVNIDAQPGAKQYKVKGGNAPIYDAGWVFRVTAASTVRTETKAKGKDGKTKTRKVGEKHEILIAKNSMGPKSDAIANFYSSIGTEDGNPTGLDLAREVREESILRKLTAYKAGTGYSVDGELVAKSKAEYLRWLRSPDADTGQLRYEILMERLNADAPNVEEDDGDDDGDDG